MVQSKQEESERNDKVIQELKEQVEELRSSYEALIKNNTTVSNFTKGSWLRYSTDLVTGFQVGPSPKKSDSSMRMYRGEFMHCWNSGTLLQAKTEKAAFMKKIDTD